MLPLLTILSVSRDKASLTCGAAIGRAGNFQFSIKSLVFCEKMSKWVIRSKMSNSLVTHFWWVTWAIRSHHSFLVSDLSDSLTKRGNERIVHFLNNKNILKIMILDFFAKPFWVNCSFAHLTWATWAIPSRSLICLERSEGIAYSRSFDLSEMSKWANSQPWLLVFIEDRHLD